MGLQPYTAAQRDYFFGRESDQRVIASNLYASRLTILYGATGVGKTSVLMAGVVPRLEAAKRTAVVVFRQWQDPSFLEALKAGCVEAVGVARGRPAGLDPRLPLDDLVLAASQAVRGSVLILLDQFEEYFVYHPESQADSPFEVELARAINREDVEVDVLATPILEWREDYVRAAERVRERRRLRRRVLQGAAVALLLIGLLGYRAYSLWLENRPWGVLTNLSTGRAHAVTGKQFTVGRNTEHYQNQVNLLPKTISRMHLMIFRNLMAVDMRSFNGTTVNAEFLPYGDSVTLRSWDIIVLGGTAPFKFETIQYARFQFWTPFLEQPAPLQGWGLLIDGRSRTVTPLERAEHFLSVRDGAIVPLQDEGKDAVLAIRWTKDGAMTVQSLSNSVESSIEWKKDDHNYGQGRLEPGIAYDRMKQNEEWASLFAATFTVGDAKFQVIRIEKNLEPSR